jgi:hypothetical protein
VLIAKAILEGLSALFAFGAAVFWFLSARVDLPVIGASLVKRDPFYAALKRAAMWNRWAAACAGVSACLQAVTFAL